MLQATPAWNVETLQSRTGALEPLLVFKECKHADAEGDHHNPDTDITVFPMQLGHVLKIHAVNANEKSERYKDRGDDGEDTHHFVSAHAQTGNVKVHNIPN